MRVRVRVGVDEDGHLVGQLEGQQLGKLHVDVWLRRVLVLHQLAPELARARNIPRLWVAAPGQALTPLELAKVVEHHRPVGELAESLALAGKVARIEQPLAALFDDEVAHGLEDPKGDELAFACRPLPLLDTDRRRAAKERFENRDQTLRRDCFGKAQPYGATEIRLGTLPPPSRRMKRCSRFTKPKEQRCVAAKAEAWGATSRKLRLGLLDPVPQAEGPGMTDYAPTALSLLSIV
jgi:hypothetical protein